MLKDTNSIKLKKRWVLWKKSREIIRWREVFLLFFFCSYILSMSKNWELKKNFSCPNNEFCPFFAFPRFTRNVEKWKILLFYDKNDSFANLSSLKTVKNVLRKNYEKSNIFVSFWNEHVTKTLGWLLLLNTFQILAIDNSYWNNTMLETTTLKMNHYIVTVPKKRRFVAFW